MKRAPLSYYANMEVRGIITVVPYFDFQKDYFRWVCNQMSFFILHGFVVKLLFSHIYDYSKYHHNFSTINHLQSKFTDLVLPS